MLILLPAITFVTILIGTREYGLKWAITWGISDALVCLLLVWLIQIGNEAEPIPIVMHIAISGFYLMSQLELLKDDGFSTITTLKKELS